MDIKKLKSKSKALERGGEGATGVDPHRLAHVGGGPPHGAEVGPGGRKLDVGVGVQGPRRVPREPHAVGLEGRL